VKIRDPGENFLSWAWLEGVLVDEGAKHQQDQCDGPGMEAHPRSGGFETSSAVPGGRGSTRGAFDGFGVFVEVGRRTEQRCCARAGEG